MNPIDYSIDVKDPFERALQGYQAGQAISAQQVKNEQAQLQFQRQKQMQSALSKLATSPDVTASDYASVMTMFPEISEKLKFGHDALNEQQKQSRLSSATQVYSALQMGDAETAKNLLAEQADALENSGRTQDAKPLRSLAETIDYNPKVAATSAGLYLAAALGPDKFSGTFTDIENQRRTRAGEDADLTKKQAEAKIAGTEANNAQTKWDLFENRTRAEIRGLESQISERAERLKLDKDKLRSDVSLKLQELDQKFGEVPKDVRDKMDAYVTNASESQQLARQSLDVAAKLDQLNQAGGLRSKGWNATVRALGLEGEEQAIRQQYTKIRTTGILKQMPGGVGRATDKDIEFLSKPFPNDDADPKYIAQFLRSLSKVQYDVASLEEAKAQWTGEVRSLNRSKKDIEVDGITVPAGMTFNDFAKKYVAKRAKEQQAQDSQDVLNNEFGEYMNPNAKQGATGNW